MSRIHPEVIQDIMNEYRLLCSKNVVGSYLRTWNLARHIVKAQLEADSALFRAKYLNNKGDSNEQMQSL